MARGAYLYAQCDVSQETIKNNIFIGFILCLLKVIFDFLFTK